MKTSDQNILRCGALKPAPLPVDFMNATLPRSIVLRCAVAPLLIITRTQSRGGKRMHNFWPVLWVVGTALFLAPLFLK
jgi:hypothetical protein